MKKMKIQIAAVTLFIGCLLISCNDNPVAPVRGEINGAVTNKDLNGSITGVSQLKIYLLDLSVKPDTVNVDNNKKLFLDSTITDANGNYKFRNLKEGKYGISPYIGSANIQINKEQSSPNDPTNIIIDNRKQDYTINFSVTYPGEDYPSDENKFEINLETKNHKGGPGEIKIQRYEFYCFIPILRPYFVGAYGEYDHMNTYISSNWYYGNTFLVYSLSNKFRFTFELWNTKEIYTFDYDLTISSCPKSASFEFDWSTKIFKRVK